VAAGEEGRWQAGGAEAAAGERAGREEALQTAREECALSSVWERNLRRERRLLSLNQGAGSCPVRWS